jgi:hypothetical protein
MEMSIMASVSNVVLSIGESTIPGNRVVNIEYTLHFSKAEAGLDYLIAIKLFGHHSS